MSQRIDFTNKVAVITGAGRGLGAAYALELARRGARVVVNDAGVASDGRGADAGPAQHVVNQITAAGGEAIASTADIVDRAQAQSMIDAARARWGAVHILINNAGIVRDRTFSKKELDDFKAVLDVHFWGTVNCTHAAWSGMLEQGYGRVLMTTSISGTLGSFGQSDYGSAKTGALGLMNTLALEGARKNVHVNSISPAAGTRITEGVISQKHYERLRPELVTPAALFLVSEHAPNKVILQAGAGQFSRVVFAQNEEVDLGAGVTLEQFAEHYEQIAELSLLFPVRVLAGLD